MTNETTTGRSAPTGTGTTGRTGTGSWSRTGETVTRRSGRAGVVESGVEAAGEAASRFAGWARRTYRVLAETVTPVGWLLVVGLVVGLLAGAVLGLIEGWVIAIAAGILLVLSLPFLLGGATFDVRLDIERNRVIAGTDVTGSLVATNLSQRFSLPGTIDVPVGEGLVEVPVPFLGKGSQHVEPVAIAARHRGVIQVGPMTITHGDPVGVLHRRSSWPQIETIYVHPRTVAIPSTSAGFIKDVEGTPTTTLVDSDLAFHAIREYQPGDSRRHVHWKSTAKTGKLMVRQYEETRRASLAVVLDLAAEEYTDDDEFELAVSAGTSLAVQGVRDGRDVLMLTPGEGRVRGGRQVSVRSLPTVSPRVLLDATCTIEVDEHAQKIENVSTLVAQTYPEISVAFIVTGSKTPIDRLRRAAFGFPSNVRTVVVRAEPGAEPKVRATREFTLLTLGVLDDIKHLIARGAIT